MVRARGRPGDQRPIASGEGPVHSLEVEALDGLVTVHGEIATGKECWPPRRPVDRCGALDSEWTSDVLGMHDDLAEPCWDVTRGRSGAGDDSPELLERLVRVRSSAMRRWLWRSKSSREPSTLASQLSRPRLAAALRWAVTSSTVHCLHNDCCAHCSRSNCSRSSARALRSAWTLGQSHDSSSPRQGRCGFAPGL